MRKGLVSLVLLVVCLELQAQKIEVQGGFMSDSMKIGQPVNYWLRAKYPKTVQLTLPDSTFKFEPFEYVEKEYHPSVIENEIIKDSVVYRLSSFEIEPVQGLSLPAFILTDGDTTLIYNRPDSVILQELALQVSDTTRLRENTSYVAVNKAFNYPLLWYVIGGLVILIAVIISLFGKKIRRYFKLIKIRKEYTRCSDYITIQVRSIKENPEPKLAESTLSEWKKFIERLEDKPYTKLTTKEILATHGHNELTEALKKIDKCVYGGVTEEDLFMDFQSIEDFTQHRYNLKLEEIKNG